MPKCKCEESRSSNPRWRIMAEKPAGRGYKYRIVCLSCEWDWWSSAKTASAWPRLSQEERERLEYPGGQSKFNPM